MEMLVDPPGHVRLPINENETAQCPSNLSRAGWSPGHIRHGMAMASSLRDVSQLGEGVARRRAGRQPARAMLCRLATPEAAAVNVLAARR
ncbi:hypothetical protein ACVCAH_13240 [Micromonospora sp. LZ34]